MRKTTEIFGLWICVICSGWGCSTHIQGGGDHKGAETCDGQDNDEDSKIDEDDPRSGEPCGDNTNVEECTRMVLRCRYGKGMECITETTATNETCNEIDDDCDGQIDESFVCNFPFGDAG